MAKEKIINLIKLEDYKIFRYFIVVFNNTSMSSSLDYENINFVEISETHFSITLPKNICQQGHSLTIYVAKKKKIVQVKKLENTKGIPNTYAFTAKVTELAPAERGLVVVTLTLTNYTKLEWEEISRSFIKKQTEISDLFNKIKFSGKEYNNGT